ncbi:MAG: ankyrin repeat domain-containing protein [Planctomycetaceae bacterium]|nr:ankyrin repeat domain-containing protein [Planctomycetaceae bacterium]
MKLSNGLATACRFVCVLSAVSMASAACAQEKTQAVSDLADSAEHQQWAKLWQSHQSGADINAAQPDGMTPLHWAAFHRAADQVQRLLQAGAAVDAANEYGVTPLQIAVSAPDAVITEHLLQAGADVHRRSAGKVTPLMQAARTGDADVIRVLLKYDANVGETERRGQTALMWAAAAGNAAATKALIDASADVNAASSQGFTALMFAARDGQPQTVQLLCKAGAEVNTAIEPKWKTVRVPRKGSTALTLAVESGHFELAMQLVHNGADPNDQRGGFTPLHILSWVRKPNRGEEVDGDPPPRGSGNLTALEFVRAMVAAGADINTRLKRGRSGKAVLNEKGATAFLFAARTADVPLMKVLLEQGADPTIPNADGCLAPMACAGIGVRAVGEYAGTEPETIAAIDYLLTLGLDINAVDDNGETAMHGAAYRNYPQLVAHLARRGADPKQWDHRNRYGWTPVMIAQGKRPGSFKPSPETVAALRAVGAGQGERDASKGE